MNLESLLSGLTIASIFLLTSELWLEFVMSAFRRAKALVAEPMMFNSSCPEIRLLHYSGFLKPASLRDCEKVPITLFLFPSLSQVMELL